MGLEATCTLHQGRESAAVRAHLNTDRLEIRGAARLDVPFKAVESIAAKPDGTLQLKHAGGQTVLVFADAKTAQKWAEKIRSPKSLIDKLGVKPDSRVAVLGVDDADFLAQATARLGTRPTTKTGANLDFLFYAADSAAELAKLKSLKSHLQPAGAIWVVSRKGREATLKDTDVMQAARAAGLVDNKVCSFSATHTALKLVIPRSAR
jgi:hypothetical protein